MNTLQLLLKERPAFHKGETEITRTIDNDESFLSSKTIKDLNNNQRRCYGVDKDVLGFLSKEVKSGFKTLETGAGCSTLIFAAAGANHLAVTPSAEEAKLIREYALAHAIPFNTVQFANESSDIFLPALKENGFDLILLDGKHAFPWPVIDWFYTADKLKQGGLMVIDDVQMRPVAMLIEFLDTDTHWMRAEQISDNTIAYSKISNNIHDVAWHMQAYSQVSPLQKMVRNIKKVLG